MILRWRIAEYTMVKTLLQDFLINRSDQFDQQSGKGEHAVSYLIAGIAGQATDPGGTGMAAFAWLAMVAVSRVMMACMQALLFVGLFELYPQPVRSVPSVEYLLFPHERETSDKRR